MRELANTVAMLIFVGFILYSFSYLLSISIAWPLSIASTWLFGDVGRSAGRVDDQYRPPEGPTHVGTAFPSSNKQKREVSMLPAKAGGSNWTVVPHKSGSFGAARSLHGPLDKEHDTGRSLGHGGKME